MRSPREHEGVKVRMAGVGVTSSWGVRDWIQRSR